MKRDMTDFLGQILTGRSRYVCDSIDDYSDNRKKISHRGDYAILSFEGHYFLSYDFVVVPSMLLWDGKNLNMIMHSQCENGLLEHFRGSKINIDIHPGLHVFNKSMNSGGVSKESIFWPSFIYQKKLDLLSLIGYEVVPRKPKKDRELLLFKNPLALNGAS